MKIRVVGQQWYRQYYWNGESLPVYELPDSLFWRINNFITIRNSFEMNDKSAVPVSGDNVLKLCFDDAVTAEPDSSLVLFNEDMANRIAAFVKCIDKGKKLFINCAAGISRSGAVGEVLNDYLNCFLEDNKEDKKYFLNNNRQICGNPLVRRVLRSILFEESFY